jgi:hypothetical protein
MLTTISDFSPARILDRNRPTLFCEATDASGIQQLVVLMKPKRTQKTGVIGMSGSTQKKMILEMG